MQEFRGPVHERGAPGSDREALEEPVDIGGELLNRSVAVVRLFGEGFVTDSAQVGIDGNSGGWCLRIAEARVCEEFKLQTSERVVMGSPRNCSGEA